MPRELRYRHVLTRVWDPEKPLVTWVCLNPSTAGPAEDDPTTRKLRGFSERWGFGRYLLVNLFPLCATDPKELHAAKPGERVGHHPMSFVQDDTIRGALQSAEGVVLAWGAHGYRFPASVAVMATRVAGMQHAERPVWHLGLTKDGQPKHPLYLPYDTERIDATDWLETYR